MTNLRCAKCAAQIVPGTNFCRSCGAPIESSLAPSEMQTALLDERVARPDTQRFEARTTTEANDAVAAVSAFTYPAQAPVAPARSRRGLVIVLAILVLLLGAGGLIGVLKRARHSGAPTLISRQFHYPGANTIVNVGSNDGAALQMETNDSIDKVEAWYEATLKPTKTMRVTGGVLIMKNDNTTVTMATTDAGTSIVIKQLAP